VSKGRWALFGEALWAVYDRYDITREAGPPIEPVRRAATPGRNDPCPLRQRQKIPEALRRGLTPRRRRRLPAVRRRT